MSDEAKTIVVVKLNTGAWMDLREQLIAKFTAEGIYDTHSDEFVRTTDGRTYLARIIPVNANFLDSIIGFEGNCDATDMVNFLKAQLTKLEQYNTLKVSVVAEVNDTNSNAPIVKIDTAQEGEDKTVITGNNLPGQTIIPAGHIEPTEQVVVPSIPGSPINPDITKVSTKSEASSESKNDPVAPENTQNDQIPAQGAEIKE